jgi:2-polyprenyl-3-methyl-5-hydroxy-6-metoxy-1,4-benzoquinol methylase
MSAPSVSSNTGSGLPYEPRPGYAWPEDASRAPEFAEHFVHYSIKQTRNSSHEYARRLGDHNRDVLEIGCGEGFFAAGLKKAGNREVGVDALPAASESHALEQYFSADLNDTRGVLRQLNGRRFDCVLLLDVLQHPLRPGQLLAEAKSALNPNGFLVVSRPNVAHFTVRLALLFGQFNYAERGILDRTHLRFCTRKTTRLRAVNAMQGALTILLPGPMGYQFVFAARPRTSNRRPS